MTPISFLLLISFFNQINIKSPEISVETEDALFTIDRIYHVLAKDSLYLLEEEKGWTVKKRNSKLESYDLKYLKNGNNHYLIYRGLGKVYKIEEDSIFSIDNSILWKSRYGR